MDAHSPPDLSCIAQDAAFLNERMETLVQQPKCKLRSEKARERHARLREVLGIEGGEPIPAYLSDNRSEDHLSAILAGECPSPAAPLPRWTEVLNEVVEAGRRSSSDASRENARVLSDYPFGELLGPFLVIARRQLQTRLSADIYSRVAPSAFVDIECALLSELSDRLGESLLDAFSKLRPEGPVLIGQFLGRPPEARQDGRYRRYVASLKADGLRRFFELYPVAARLAATKFCDVLDLTCELLTRFAADFHELWPEEDRTGGSAVAHLTFGLSDPHGGGRCVMVITMRDGRRIVYKPRSLAPEQAWNKLLAILDPDLKRPRVIERGTYGWMEFVAPADCASAAQIDLFFRRLGKLICASFIFGGKDFHRDNLIAAGDQPVLVDLETLGQPDPRSIATMIDPIAVASQARHELLRSSVMRAEFLPQWRRGADGHAHDESALSSPADHRSTATEWRGLGTDLITRIRTTRSDPGKNFPSLDGVHVRAQDHTAAILSGFADAWTRLGHLGPPLVAEDGALAAMRDLPFRFVFRATQVYYAIVRRACAPQNLRSGLDFSIELQGLHQASAGCKDAALRLIVAAEIDALQRGDIPRFCGSTSSDALHDGLHHRVPGYFAGSGIDLIERRLGQLTPSGLEEHLRIIAMVLAGEKGRNASPFVVPAGRCGAATTTSDSFGPEQALASAHAIGEELTASAMRLPDGGLCWAGLTYREEAAGFQVEAMNDGLYEGNGGQALFFAALHRADGDARFRAAALDALTTVRALVRNPSLEGGAGATQLGLGAGRGIGGLIYVLVRISRFLEDEALLEDARVLSHWLSEDVIVEQSEWDVLNGSSGALAGLLALAEAIGDRHALALACVCGRHVLARIRQADPSSRKGSFAHGTAGAAALLARLADRAGDKALLRTALDLLHDEASAGASVPAVDGHEAAGRLGWCNGHAGLGLAGLTARGGMDGPCDPVISTAIDVILHSRGAATDQICCGSFGGIDLLLSAGRTFHRPDLEREAWRRAGTIVSRAKEEGGFRLLPGVPPSYAGPGLFQGLAGIGYGLLRLAAPGRLPSILMME